MSSQICTMGLEDRMLGLMYVLNVWSLQRPSYFFFQVCHLVIAEYDVESQCIFFILFIKLPCMDLFRQDGDTPYFCGWNSSLILHTTPTHFKSLLASADFLESRRSCANISIGWSYSITYFLHWYWCSSQLFNFEMKVLLRDLRDRDWAPVNINCYWLELYIV